MASAQRVAKELGGYIPAGNTTFILDIPPFEEELDHTNIVVRQALEQAPEIFPFWIPRKDSAGYVQLPYTLRQDSALFLLLQEMAIDVWKGKVDWVAAHGGSALVVVHPD